ncbi:hypothetical protein GMMP13_710025 [Candidatus Magnetomoraceae bacterium gMMP-13]
MKDAKYTIDYKKMLNPAQYDAVTSQKGPVKIPDIVMNTTQIKAIRKKTNLSQTISHLILMLFCTIDAICLSK